MQRHLLLFLGVSLVGCAGGVVQPSQPSEATEVSAPVKRRPRVRQARLVVARGSVDNKVVRQVLWAKINQVTSCYNGARSDAPNLAGHVELYFEVDETGAVTASEIRPGDESMIPVAECLRGPVSAWTFPPEVSESGARFMQPYKLSVAVP